MKKIYFLLISLICLNFGFSQSPNTPLVTIDRNNNTRVGFTTTAGTNNDNITANGFTRGSGVNQTGMRTDPEHKTKGWNATSLATAEANNDYIQWSVTSNQDFNILLTELSIRLKRTATGPANFRIYYSLDNFVTKNPVNSEETLIETALDFTYNGAINSGFNNKVTIRLYAWNASDMANGELHIVENTSWASNNVSKPGSILRGSLTYDGLMFVDDEWSPIEPDATTGAMNALIINGSYYLNSDVTLNNVKIENDGSVYMLNLGNLNVNGDIDNSGYFTMESDSQNYPSLIVNGSANGEYNYERHVNKTPNNDMISAPFSGEKFSDFILKSPNNVNVRSNASKTSFLFGPFDKSSGSYLLWANTNNTVLSPATGYKVGTTADNQSLSFTGSVTTGTFDKTITNSGPVSSQWNLIGNPYPSYIKLSDFLAENNFNFDENSSGVYGWKGDYPNNTWEIWNLAYSGLHPNAAIAPGQGFMVAAKSGISTTVKFKPEMRTSGSTDDFIAGRNSNPDHVGFLNLEISNGKQNYSTDIYFNEQSTKGLDIGYDTSVFGKTAPEFSVYSHLVEGNTGIDMAIQSLPFADLSTNDLSVPLGIKVSEGQQIVVRMAQSTLPEGVEIYLEDNVDKTFVLLNNSDYTFTASSNLTETGRFFLHTTNGTLSTPSNDLNGLQIYASSADKTLHVKGLITNNTVLNIYDIQGRLINATQLKANTNSNQVELSTLSTGVYVVELKNSTLIRTQKVILK